MSTRKAALIRVAVLCLLPAACSAHAAPSAPSTPSVQSDRPPQFGELTRLGRGKTDKADVHGFTTIYEDLFAPLKSSPIRFCEIGIAGGGSLRLWSEYFPRATVFGIDLFTLDQLHALLRDYPDVPDMLPEKPETDRVKTFVADQSNRTQLKSFVDRYGGNFDIVLDDGGHSMEQQQVSFGFFFRYLKPGGYYVIEDVHTSLPDRYPDYGVQHDESNSTLTMIDAFNRHGRITSPYLRREEIDYVNSHIEFVNLFTRNNDGHSMTCIIRKKATD